MSTFKSLDNIETSFKLMKTAFIVFSVVCLFICISAIGITFYAVNQANSRIYILGENGEALTAQASTIEENRGAEIKNHIIMLYGSFFSYDPNNLEPQIKKGLALMGTSGKELYQTFLDDGWYNRVMQNNITLKSSINIDDIQVNTSIYPYECYAKGTQIISRESFNEKRVLEFSCKLYNVSRSEDNPHGLLIDNFILIDNKTLSDENQ